MRHRRRAAVIPRSAGAAAATHDGLSGPCINRALEPPARARLVRPDIARPAPDEAVVDGTVMPGANQIQAFYLIDVPDVDTALAWAKRLPTYGTVEVRVLLDY